MITPDDYRRMIAIPGALAAIAQVNAAHNHLRAVLASGGLDIDALVGDVIEPARTDRPRHLTPVAPEQVPA